jgi:hypothetical protein
MVEIEISALAHLCLKQRLARVAGSLFGVAA